MLDLIPLCALGATTPQEFRQGALTLTEMPETGLVSLTLRRGAARPALDLPEPGFWATGAGHAAFWTGPGQWFIELPERAQEDPLPFLAPQAPGCSLTEQTDGWVLFELQSSQGAEAIEAFLEHAVNLDLSKMGPGRSTRSVIEHMGVYLLRRSDDRLAIWGMRSAAESLWHALTTLARRQSARG
ncbi:sarcosine oxidase subunit gamma [Cereibacter sphaeroides]|nr:sarcosine oxidase subunit gamma [Cereibacter sphaeroides]